MICVGCGCTDERACVDQETGEPCHWPTGVDPFEPLCSACVRMEALLEEYGDAVHEQMREQGGES